MGAKELEANECSQARSITYLEMTMYKFSFEKPPYGTCSTIGGACHVQALAHLEIKLFAEIPMPRLRI
jgi:hypothetical protein